MKESNVVVEIYNYDGQKITSLINNNLAAGAHIIEWNGKDESGIAMPSSIYFCSFKTDDFKTVKKIILLR